MSATIPSIKVTQREREGLEWLRQRRAAAAAEQSIGQVSAASVVRSLLRRELKTEGFDPDAPAGSPPVGPKPSAAKPRKAST